MKKKNKKIIGTRQEIIGAGPRIREWRKRLRIKAFALAKILKISQGSLSDIENGNSNPSASTIYKFILYTDINIYWMLTGKDGDIKKGDRVPPPQVFTLNPGSQLLIKCNK